MGEESFFGVWLLCDYLESFCVGLMRWESWKSPIIAIDSPVMSASRLGEGVWNRLGIKSVMIAAIKAPTMIKIAFVFSIFILSIRVLYSTLFIL